MDEGEDWRGADDGRQAGLDLAVLRSQQPVQPASGRHLAGQDRGQRRLVQLDQQLPAGHPLADLGQVGAEALGERPGEIGHRAGVGQCRVLAAGQLDGRRQRPRPADLQLQRPGVAASGLRQRVQVGGEQIPRPAEVAPRPAGEPPAGRGGLHRQVDQQGGGPAGQPGGGAAGRQLGEMGQARQLAEDDPHGFGWIGPGHGADTGRAARGPGIGRLGADSGHGAELRGWSGHPDAPHRAPAACGVPR